MDYRQAQQYKDLADSIVELARQYAEQREVAGSSKADLDILLTANLERIRKDRPSIGYDMAVLRLCETDKVAQGLFKAYKTAESKYKGLERILDAQQSKLIMVQAIMKRFNQGEKYGV